MANPITAPYFPRGTKTEPNQDSSDGSGDSDNEAAEHTIDNIDLKESVMAQSGDSGTKGTGSAG